VSQTISLTAYPDVLFIRLKRSCSSSKHRHIVFVSSTLVVAAGVQYQLSAVIARPRDSDVGDDFVAYCWTGTEWNPDVPSWVKFDDTEVTRGLFYGRTERSRRGVVSKEAVATVPAVVVVYQRKT
jgi:hypothetical protein